MKGFIDILEASEKWNLTTRRVRVLCEAGRIDGAIKLNTNWFIPEGNEKPLDGRALRKLKTHAIQIGIIDVDNFESLKAETPLNENLIKSDLLKDISSSVLTYYLKRDNNIDITKDQVLDILNGNLNPSYPLSLHYLIGNFNATLLEGVNGFNPSMVVLAELNKRLLCSIDNFTTFRQGTSFISHDAESHSVDSEFYNLFVQYQQNFRDLHALSQAFILYGEIERIKLIESYNGLFSYLVMASVLLSNGYLPPILETEEIEEEKAALSLSCKRSIYNNLNNYFGRGIERSYEKSKSYLV